MSQEISYRLYYVKVVTRRSAISLSNIMRHEISINKNGNKDRLGCFRNVWISFIRVLSDDNQLGYEVWKKEFVNCLDILLVEQSQGWRKIQVRILIQ